MMDLIKIKPVLALSFSCPHCGAAATTVGRISVPGMYWVADCHCPECDNNFMQNLPVGHMLDYPLAINKKSKRLYPDDWNLYWQAAPFLRACETFRSNEVSIKKMVYREHKKVIILNALDYLYGHTLLKLYNALHHLDHHREFGLIIIIPRIFEWMIPKGCAEAWIVNLSLSELAYGYEAIERFVLNECERFDEINVSRAYSHPDFTKVDISRFTGVQPFDLDTFYQKGPFFTFVLRNDRWWLRNRLSEFGFRLSRRLNITKIAGRILTKRQDVLVRRTIELIRRELPNAEFCVTGVGNGGSLAKWARDKRTTRMNREVEQEWCRTYAMSHVVIGVHGSNMLLPTAHAAGCVEVLMEERNRNIVQDISVRYNDRRQLFFYRFVDQFVAPRSVAAKAVAIYKNYENCFRNMVLNLYR